MKLIKETVISIEKIKCDSFKYDIKVKNNNNFFANGILVHNCQNMPWICEQEKDTIFSATEKLDGTSATFALIKTEGRSWWNKFLLPEYTFVVCSRNLHLKKPNGSFYWEMAIKKDMKNILQRLIGSEKFVILQGEIIGEGVQGNKLKLKGREFYAFNLIYPNKQVEDNEMFNTLLRYGIKCVPLLHTGYKLKDTIPECVELAKGKSILNSDVLREGIVVRNYTKKLSFKIMNPDFLIKYDE